MNFKIIIIDDDPTILVLHKSLVNKRLGSQPLVFANGKLGLDFFLGDESTADNYLILLDINMPVMDGWGFLDAIQHHPIKASIQVIMVTSSIDVVDKEKAMEYPQVIAYLEKPLRIAACDKIKELPTLVQFFTKQ